MTAPPWTDLRVLSVTGAALQALFALITSLMLVHARRTSPVRSGVHWAQAQAALLVAMVAVIVRNTVGTAATDSIDQRLLNGLYTGAKLAFFSNTALGVAELLGRVPPQRLRRQVYVITAVIGAAIALWTSRVQDTMPLQGLVGLVLMSACAVALFRARAPFRSAGTLLLGITTSCYALLAVTYLLGWRYTNLAPNGGFWPIALEIIDRGSLPDVFAQFLLGVTTVALLYEQQRNVTHSTGLQRHALQREALTTERLETLGRVAATVAHELNNPLSVVLGTSEHLLASSPPPAMRDDLQLMWREAMRCRHVARELLLFSRDSRPAVAPCDAATILTDCASSVRLQAAASGVLLRVMPGDPLALWAEEIALQQVLINLLRNAIDATPRGRSVRATVRAVDGAAQFEVDDEGPGLHEDVRAQPDALFVSTKPAGEGTGLGLAIVRGIVARHGGTITFENHLTGAVGLRVTVRIPLEPPEGRPLPEEDEALVPLTTHEELDDVPRPSTGDHAVPARVLVVDDEVGIRRVLSRVLERQGAVVITASDGQEAQEVLGSHDGAWHAIFCDVRMPRMDGLAFTSWLETTHPALLRRHVLLTGDTVSDVVTAVAARTGCHLLAKPFRHEDVHEILRRLAVGPVSPRVDDAARTVP